MNPSVQEFENVLFISNIDNWAHFIEDVLPRIILASTTDKFDAILMGGKISELNREIIARFTKVPIISLEPDSTVRAKHCIIVVQEIRRSLAQTGKIEDLSLVDSELMRKMRESLESNADGATQRIYIGRSNNQFRRLVNRKSVEEYLTNSGFLVVAAENLGLQERLDLFASADVIVAESGAGLVNCYFCKPNTTVIEIRHPGMSKNLEYLDAAKICALDYRIALGTKASIFSRIFLGNDSFIVDLDKLKEKMIP
jgi:capsular polysaccharide biosynthesis protein